MRSILSRIPFREAARWAFLIAVAVALYYAPDLSPPPQRTVAVVPHKKPPPPKTKPALPAKPPKPKGPSVFEQEQALSLRELMARWDPIVRTASKRFKVSEAWIRAVMRMESGGRTMLAEGKPITSTAGAMGIMQLMPDTYANMRALYGLGTDPYDPSDNVMAGTAYLAILYRAYGYPQMFAAYNDGPKMLEAHNAGLHPWPVETVNYISGITAILSGGSPSRVGGAQVRLTRPDGAPVMVDAFAVVSIRAAFPGEYAPGVLSVLHIQKMRQGVRESVGAATALIRAHGGRI